MTRKRASATVQIDPIRTFPAGFGSGPAPGEAFRERSRGSTMTEQRSRALALGSIFGMIFRISAFTLGGGPVLIGIIQQELRSRELLPEEELTDMMALSMAAPGAMGVSMSYQVGLALGGVPGAAAAVVAMALPPFLAILILSGWLLGHLNSPYVASFFSGASAALVIVLGAIVWNTVRRNALGCYHDALVAAAVALSILVLGVSPVWALVVGTAVSVVKNLVLQSRKEDR